MQNDETRGIELSPKERARYKRHLSLPQIGINGQKKLKGSSVLCVGSGGLGSPILMYLAAAGVGRIGIADFDLVDESNLQRQVIHGINWLGRPKIASARDRISQINPNCQVDTFETPLNENNALEIIKKFDLICDCTDNFPSRYLINDACVILGKPNIYGSIGRFEGQASVFNLDQESPNYRDLVPEPPPSELLPSCAEGGVLGVLPGIIGLIQATEAIKIITKIGTTPSGRLLIFDALGMKFKELTLKKTYDNTKINHLINYQDFCSNETKLKCDYKNEYIESISTKELKVLLQATPQDIILLDVRTPLEHDAHSIQGSRSVPLEKIENGEAIEFIRKISSGLKVYAYCESGKRSLKALIKLKSHQIKGINITGGMLQWTKETFSDINN